MTVEKRREAFIENKKAKMKQAQSLVEVKNKQNKKMTEILNAQNSDCDITYASLLTNECVLEHIFSNEGMKKLRSMLFSSVKTVTMQCLLVTPASDICGLNISSYRKTFGIVEARRRYMCVSCCLTFTTANVLL